MNIKSPQNSQDANKNENNCESSNKSNEQNMKTEKEKTSNNRKKMSFCEYICGTIRLNKEKGEQISAFSEYWKKLISEENLIRLSLRFNLVEENTKKKNDEYYNSLAGNDVNLYSDKKCQDKNNI